MHAHGHAHTAPCLEHPSRFLCWATSPPWTSLSKAVMLPKPSAAEGSAGWLPGPQGTHWLGGGRGTKTLPQLQTGAHDPTWPITALDYLGPITGLVGRHMTQWSQSESFPGTESPAGRKTLSCQGSLLRNRRLSPDPGAPEDHRWAGSH